jgi:hypothetical protein
LPFGVASNKMAAPERGRPLRQILWCSLQVGVVALVIYWSRTPDMQATSAAQSPMAVGVFAILMAAAVTAAVMIVRDVSLWLGRLIRRAITSGKADQPHYGPGRIDARPGASEPRKLTSRLRIGKQPRKLIDVTPHSPPLDRL